MFGIDNIVSVGLEIINKVIPDPQAKLAAQERLLQMQQDKELKEEDFDIKREEIAAGDRDSARKRDIETKDNVNRNLAYIIVGAFIGVIVATLAGYSKADSVLAGTLIGYLSAKAEQVISYYFGSTRSSAQKNETIQDLMRK